MSSPTLVQVLQPLTEHCVECAIHHERDVHDEQHPYGANKQTENYHDVGSSLLLGATM